jgi:hypothetical protein
MYVYLSDISHRGSSRRSGDVIVSVLLRSAHARLFSFTGTHRQYNWAARTAEAAETRQFWSAVLDAKSTLLIWLIGMSAAGGMVHVGSKTCASSISLDGASSRWSAEVACGRQIHDAEGSREIRSRVRDWHRRKLLRILLALRHVCAVPGCDAVNL